jgi:hypothetical protein
MFSPFLRDLWTDLLDLIIFFLDLSFFFPSLLLAVHLRIVAKRSC